MEPVSYFRRADELGVHCIAFTEHHVLDSLQEVLRIARDYPDVRTIPAAEITVTASIGSVDLLCYGFPPSPTAELRNVLDIYHAWQRSYGAAISKALQALGYDFPDSERLAVLESYRPARTIAIQGNTHVRNGVLRQYFIDRGFIKKEEEYSELLSRARELLPFPPYPDASIVIPALREAGSVIAIAHPYKYFNGCETERMDALREECCLNGIECAHRAVPREYTPRYRKYCLQHNLFSVGGSDCHTNEDVCQIFARHLGADEWLDEFLAVLDSR